jgi:hypothetical protein
MHDFPTLFPIWIGGALTAPTNAGNSIHFFIQTLHEHDINDFPSFGELRKTYYFGAIA